MRNPHGRTRMRLVRRALSHHDSDCSMECRRPREHRCLILTRVDYLDGRPSETWLSGDCAETCSMAAKRRWWLEDHGYELGKEGMRSERMYRKRHTFDPTLPVWYGGGFWERVQIEPATAADWMKGEGNGR